MYEVRVTATDTLATASDTFIFTILSLFEALDEGYPRIRSKKQSENIEIIVTGAKITINNYSSARGFDISNAQMKHWQISGKPDDINTILENI